MGLRKQRDSWRKSRKDPDKTREYYRLWRERNRENIRAYAREYKLSNYKQTLLYSAKARAKRRGVPFELQVEDLLWPEICPVLGIKLYYGGLRTHAYNDSPSLDRLIPETGYVRGNVLVVSNRANRLRSNMSMKDLENIYIFYKDIFEEK